MLSKANVYQRSYRTQRLSEEQKNFSCIIYVDDPCKYSIVNSRRLIDVDERGYGTIKELGKTYAIHVEQTGTIESMERYGQLLEKAMQSQMHDEIPSDCEEWMSKKAKGTQPKNFNGPPISSSRSPLIQQIQSSSPKEFSLRHGTPENRTTSSPASSLHKEALPLPRTRASLNKEQESTVRHSAETASDDDLSYDDEENEGSDKEINIKRTTFSSYTPSTTTVAGLKRKSAIQQQYSVSKCLRFSTNDPDDKHECEQLTLEQVLDHMKEVNSTLSKLQKQQQHTIVTVELQDSFLQILCKNQKKLVKSLNKHRIPISLEDEIQHQDTDEDQSNDANVIYTRSDVVVVDLVSVTGDKQNTVKYTLKLIDVLFVDKQEFHNINVKQADEDPRIKSIYKAVMKKFHYSTDNMSVIWPPIHDSILSKRRNQQKQLKCGTNTNLIQQSMSTVETCNNSKNAMIQ